MIKRINQEKISKKGGKMVASVQIIENEHILFIKHLPFILDPTIETNNRSTINKNLIYKGKKKMINTNKSKYIIRLTKRSNYTYISQLTLELMKAIAS